MWKTEIENKLKQIKNKIKNKLKQIKNQIKTFKNLIKNLMENKEKQVMVTTYSGKSVPLENAFYVDTLDAYFVDESEFQEFVDNETVVWDHFYDDYIWRDNAMFGYIDSDWNRGYFSQNAPYQYVNGRSHRYAMNSDIMIEVGYYLWEDGEWYDESEDDDDEDYLWSYHTDKRSWLADAGAEFRIAFEVEKEDRELKYKETANACFNRTGWAKERDGSLCDDTGFEFISPVYDLSKIDRTTFTDVQDYLNADYSKSCGGHINVSHVAMTGRELYQTIKAYMPLLYALYPKRTNNTYCRGINKFDDASEKYGAVHIKGGRLEFRIFSAVRSIDNLMWRISLIKYMVSNRNVSEADVLKSMLDGRSKLHGILRKVYKVDDIIEKSKLFYDYCRTYSFEIQETQNVLVKRKIMKKPKKKKIDYTNLDPRWFDTIMIFDESELTPEQLDEFFNITDRPMTTLPIETN